VVAEPVAAEPVAAEPVAAEPDAAREPSAAGNDFLLTAKGQDAAGVPVVDVPRDLWARAALQARDDAGMDFFDWLSAVDVPDGDPPGVDVVLHVADTASTGGGGVRRMLLRTRVPDADPHVESLTAVWPGAAWHERETFEMFGISFAGHPDLQPLLLPPAFEGHPLRKEFVLASRVAKAWPGAKEPGESESGAAKRAPMRPPGVPDPNEWGPLKGTLPPAETPARRAPGERPVRTPGERPDRPPRAAGERPERPVRAPGERPERPVRAPGERPERPVRAPGERPERPVRATGERPERPPRPPAADGPPPATPPDEEGD
jgi:NADH-quinone oxidoreductase subunit C